VIVSGGDDGTVRVWDGSPAELRGNPLTGHNSRVETLAIGRVEDRDVIISGGDDGIRIWDAATGHPTRHLDWMPEQWRHDQGIKAVAVGRARNRDVIVSLRHGGRIEADDIDTGMGLRSGSLQWNGAILPTIVAESTIWATSPAVSSDRDTVRAWPVDAPPGTILAPDHGVTPEAIGQIGGRYVTVSGHADGILRIWNLLSRCVASLGVQAQESPPSQWATSLAGM
jgi:WD40 repeat protein